MTRKQKDSPWGTLDSSIFSTLVLRLVSSVYAFPKTLSVFIALAFAICCVVSLSTGRSADTPVEPPQPPPAPTSSPTQEPILDLVFDIDLTLISPIVSNQVDTASQRGMTMIQHNSLDLDYAVFPMAGEILSLLNDLPWAHLHFFSAGGQGSNLIVLNELKLADGLTAKERALSVRSGHERKEGTSLGLVTGFKVKDLSIFATENEEPESWRDRVFLIDDSAMAVRDTQSDNWIPVFNYSTLFNVWEVDTLEQGASAKSSIQRNAYRSKYRLVEIFGMILRAREMSVRDSITFREAINLIKTQSRFELYENFDAGWNALRWYKKPKGTPEWNPCSALFRGWI